MPSAQIVRHWIVLQELAASRRGRKLAELSRSAEVNPPTVEGPVPVNRRLAVRLRV